jgi:Bax protein
MPDGYKLWILVAGSLIGFVFVVCLLWPSAPNFTEFAAGEDRKQAFIRYFVPLITATNANILKDRETALELRSRSAGLGFFDRRSLHSLTEGYALQEFDEKNDQHWNELLKRINTVPPSLALAQAANESAWGTSRFAREGNNYFGQWCFEPGCGLVPVNRTAGKTHEVAKFSSPAESVTAYINNLNRNSAYENLRSIRAQRGDQTSSASGTQLATGLVNYSERGQEYVLEIQSMIRINQLEQYDKPGS